MRWRRSHLLVVAVALFPVVAEWLYKFAVRPRPFWIHYYDPETIHFYQSLRLLSGLAPQNVDSPGTPVQLAGAAIALFTGRSPLAYAHFISVAHITGLVVTIAGVVLLARTLLRDVPPMLAIAAIWTWFMAPQALEYQMVWSAEIFFFGLGAASLAAIAASLSGPRSALRDVLAGVSIGVLIATKFVFLAWLPALAVAYLAARDRAILRTIIATLGAIGGFVAATAVAITRYPAMLSWLTKLAANSGTYGSGRRELPRLHDVLANYLQVAVTAKSWMIWLAIIAVCAAVTFVRGMPRSRPIIVFGAVASALTMLMAVRAPAFRYLFPVALCAVLLLGIASIELQKVRGLPAALFVLAALFLGKAIANDIRNHQQRIDSQLALHDEVTAALRSVAPNGVVVYSWRFPAPSYALRIEATTPGQLTEIERQYPREGHYNNWQRRVYLPASATRWDVLVIDRALLPRFPMPVGRTVARFEQFDVVLPPPSGVLPTGELRDARMMSK